MSGALQAVFQNQRSFSSVPAIGSAYGGGYFAGQISTAGNSIADFNLVVGPKASAQSSTTLQLKTSASSTAGTTSLIDGPTNSSNMNNASNPAAQFCEGLTIGGFSDWYLPAANELDVCYFNLKPAISSNTTSGRSGINANAVPARASNYTSSVPAQTSVTSFQIGNSEAFADNSYWSSTQDPSFSTSQLRIDFYTGLQDARTKVNDYNVRAIRRVAV